jgi:hypothetical protein
MKIQLYISKSVSKPPVLLHELGSKNIPIKSIGMLPIRNMNHHMIKLGVDAHTFTSTQG